EGGNLHGEGEAILQTLSIHPRPQLLYKPGGPASAWVEVPFAVQKKEPLRLLLNVTKSYDFGQYQAFLDGVKLGAPVDLFSAEIQPFEFHLLDFWPEPGAHRLRLECVGKNPQSSGYFLGLESLV